MYQFFVQSIFWIWSSCISFSKIPFLFLTILGYLIRWACNFFSLFHYFALLITPWDNILSVFYNFSNFFFVLYGYYLSSTMFLSRSLISLDIIFIFFSIYLYLCCLFLCIACSYLIWIGSLFSLYMYIYIHTCICI